MLNDRRKARTSALRQEKPARSEADAERDEEEDVEKGVHASHVPAYEAGEGCRGGLGGF